MEEPDAAPSARPVPPSVETRQPEQMQSGADSCKTADDTQTSEAPEQVIRTDIIYSPVTGTAADLSETPDEAFAGRMMGDGAMVIPSESEVTAPKSASFLTPVMPSAFAPQEEPQCFSTWESIPSI